MDKYFSNRFFRIAASVMARRLSIVFLLLMPLAGHGQGVYNPTMGTDFWVMFLRNYDAAAVSYKLIAACDSGTVVSASNLSTGWSVTDTATATGCVTINVPATTAFQEVSHVGVYDVTYSGGIHVTSSRPIALYVSSYRLGTYEAATIYPTAVMGTHYMAQSYSENDKTEVGFVAVENNTRLSMNVPVFGPRVVTLMRGQCYRMGGTDFSGMEVTSNGKPFAMFQGTPVTKVGGTFALDHLYEQAIPVDYWGNRFMLVSTAERTSGDLVQITSLRNCCDIYFNDTLLATLQAGESFLYNLPSDSAGILRSTRPVSAMLYMKGNWCNDDKKGDPASVLIPPLQQAVSYSMFRSLGTPSVTLHHANIVAPNSAVPFMRFDGVPIDSCFTATPGGYAYARLSVPEGDHTLSCDSGRFVAWCYGLSHIGGLAEGYAYIAGSANNNLAEKLYVDGRTMRGSADTLYYCVGDTIAVWVNGGGNDVIPVWRINSTVMDIDTTYFKFIPDTSGSYRIEAIYSCDTLFANIRVYRTSIETFTDTNCFGPYTWREHFFDSTGVYSDTLKTSYGCDSIFTLELTVIPRPDVAILRDVDCHESTYSLSADLTEVEGWTFTWSSTPHDTMLDGHEHDTAITVKPGVATLYALDVDYLCPFRDTVILLPVEGVVAAWEINPDILTYEHPWIDAYDLSKHVTERQWFVNQTLQSDTNAHLYYFVSNDEDSVEVMLVLNGSTCPDTLRRTLPFSHTTLWVPNVFTPDAGDNNRFVVTLHEGIAEELVIYNRQGLLVARMEGPTLEWDGTRDGSPCPQGAYVWVLRHHSIDRPEYHKTITGTVTLIR